MAPPPGFSLECSLPTGRPVSTEERSAWELKAARRALQNLKTLIDEQTMLKLLDTQIEAGDHYFKQLIQESHGQFKESRVDFHAKGLTSTQFLAWFGALAAHDGTTHGRRSLYLDLMAPAHPEHYALGPYFIGNVETIGRHMCRIQMDIQEEVPDFVKAYGDPAYPIKLANTGLLDDGTAILYGFQELRDVDDGCDFRTRILFPAASPQILFDEHTEHLAIEFGHWIVAASESPKI